jgi:hypothetical protein
MIENNLHFRLVNNAFPHIGKNIRLLWGHPEFALYMGKLMADTRNGQRRGFPDDVHDSMLRLLEQHDRDFPRAPEKANPKDLWSDQPDY